MGVDKRIGVESLTLGGLKLSSRNKDNLITDGNKYILSSTISSVLFLLILLSCCIPFNVEFQKYVQ